jgi:serine/threonine-protein kinase ULK/ATG1
MFNHGGLKEDLQSDSKFNAVFDLNFIEFESFYIILQSFLRTSIHEMNHLVKNKVKDEEDVLPPPLDGSIVLLDYLVTYF